MAPLTVTKPGAVLPQEAVSFLDEHVFPEIPGRWMPGVPQALDAIGIDAGDPAAVDAFKDAAAEAGAALEFGDYEFEPEPEPVDEERAALLKLKVPALLAHARSAGVPNDELEALSKPGTAKATIIDAIAAAAARTDEEA